MQELADFSTYRTGVLQARAYRNLRHFMERTLSNQDLTSTEWSILGVISEETKNGGIRVSHLAKMLDVEISFITNIVKGLNTRGYADHVKDEDDGRVRLVVATDKAHLKVIELEKYMRKDMRKWLEDVADEDLKTYIKVLHQLSLKSS